jgi:hypothetical protein
MVPPVVVMVLATVFIGLFGNSLFRYTERAADQLLDSESYQRAVLFPEGQNVIGPSKPSNSGKEGM